MGLFYGQLNSASISTKSILLLSNSFDGAQLYIQFTLYFVTMCCQCLTTPTNCITVSYKRLQNKIRIHFDHFTEVLLPASVNLITILQTFAKTPEISD
jgi:hypothetical protein